MADQAVATGGERYQGRRWGIEMYAVSDCVGVTEVKDIIKNGKERWWDVQYW